MKKILSLILAVAWGMNAYATDMSNIKIQIKGASTQNKYFLCISDAGCFSIAAAQRGKIFPLMHTIPMSTIFIMDVTDHFRLYPQGLPPSCNVTVNSNQTIVIKGALSKGNDNVSVQHLQCQLS